MLEENGYSEYAYFRIVASQDSDVEVSLEVSMTKTWSDHQSLLIIIVKWLDRIVKSFLIDIFCELKF